MRLTQLRSNTTATDAYPTGYIKPDDLTPDIRVREKSTKTSQVFELNYQASARDVLSFAHSVYEIQSDITAYSVDPSTLGTQSQEYPQAYYSRTVNSSISWRRDWQKGVFTVLQCTLARADSARNDFGSTEPTFAASNGTAIGLRLGYRF